MLLVSMALPWGSGAVAGVPAAIFDGAGSVLFHLLEVWLLSANYSKVHWLQFHEVCLFSGSIQS